ncbi:MAG TPA: NAD(P)H-dependent oxidoreductase [Flavobacterium sp.]|jgi:nitroreductase
MHPFIKNQNWRYSTKKFDPLKIVSDGDFETLKEAIRLSPSSYGLQPYRVVIVQDKSVREQLRIASGQPQFTEASHLMIFANDIRFDASRIDDYIMKVSLTRGIPPATLDGYGTFMKSQLVPMENELKSNWTAKQTYLALGNLLNAAAELRIDVTAMEGFDANAFNKVLGLTELGLNSTVAAAIGYRHSDDAAQHHKKVRKSTEELFINL